jgi:hypothetical protein
MVAATELEWDDAHKTKNYANWSYTATWCDTTKMAAFFIVTDTTTPNLTFGYTLL